MIDLALNIAAFVCHVVYALLPNVGICIFYFLLFTLFLPLAWFNSRLLGRGRLVTYYVEMCF